MEVTLLLVEDDRLVLHTLSRGLRDAGYRILEADSALCKAFHKADYAKSLIM